MSKTWGGVHEYRNLLAHAPDALHEEVAETFWVCRWADCTDMIGAETAKEVQARHRALLRKWRLRRPAVAASLEEAGNLAQTALRFRCLFGFLRLPASQWKSARTTNAIERLHEEFKHRIKTQTALPYSETAMLFRARLASGQVTMRKADGWQTLGEKIAAPVLLTAPPSLSSYQPAGGTPLMLLPHKSRQHLLFCDWRSWAACP